MSWRHNWNWDLTGRSKDSPYNPPINPPDKPDFMYEYRPFDRNTRNLMFPPTLFRLGVDMVEGGVTEDDWAVASAFAFKSYRPIDHWARTGYLYADLYDVVNRCTTGGLGGVVEDMPNIVYPVLNRLKAHGFLWGYTLTTNNLNDLHRMPPYFIEGDHGRWLARPGPWLRKGMSPHKVMSPFAIDYKIVSIVLAARPGMHRGGGHHTLQRRRS